MSSSSRKNLLVLSALLGGIVGPVLLGMIGYQWGLHLPREQFVSTVRMEEVAMFYMVVYGCTGCLAGPLAGMAVFLAVRFGLRTRNK